MSGGWYFKSSVTNEAILKPLCQRAEEIIQLPDLKLCRYFSTTDISGWFEDSPYLRGFQAPASIEWPWEDLEDQRRFFDQLIYIRNTTCLDPIGCTITYAHELQHVMQHVLYPKVLELNRALRYYLPDFKPAASEADLPAEVDANIVSKHVAELVWGADATRKYGEEQMSSMRVAGATAQIAKWEFFLNTRASTVYEPLAPTLDAVKEYDGRINFKMDVKGPEWWLGSVLRPWMPDAES